MTNEANRVNDNDGLRTENVKRLRALLWAFFLIALVLRVVYVCQYPSGLQYPDSKSYVRIAENILSGKGFGETADAQASRMPGYPLFLAGLLWAAGPYFLLSVRLVQAVLSAFTVFLVYAIGRAWKGERIGLAAAGYATIYPFSIHYPALVLSETLFTFLLLAAVFFFLRFFEQHNGRAAIASGLLFGLATLVRASALLLPMALFCLYLLFGRRKGSFLKALLFIAFFFLVQVPWLARNWRVFHRFVPTTLVVGASLYEGVGPDATGAPMMDRINWASLRHGADEFEGNQILERKAWKEIAENPARILRLALVKFARFWNPYPNAVEFRTLPHMAASALAVIPLLVFGLIGFLLSIRSSRSILLVTPIIYYSLLHSLFVGSIRYRFPIIGLVMVFAAYPMNEFVNLFRRRVSLLSKPGAASIVAFVLSFVLVVYAEVHAVNLNIAEIARCEAEKSIRKMVNGKVVVASVKAGFLSTTLEGVCIYPVVGSQNAPVVLIKQVVTRLRILPMLRWKFKPKRMEIFNIELNLVRSADGSWNTKGLFKKRKKKTDPLPIVIVHRGMLKIRGEMPGDTIPCGSYVGEMLLTPNELNSAYRLHGYLIDPQGIKWETKGVVRRYERDMHLSLQHKRLELAVDELTKLPHLSGASAFVKSLSGEMDITVHLAFRLDATEEVRFGALARWRNVNIQLEGVPCTIANMRGQITLDGQRLRIETLAASCSGAKISISGWVTIPALRPGSKKAETKAKFLVGDGVVSFSLKDIDLENLLGLAKLAFPHAPLPVVAKGKMSSSGKLVLKHGRISDFDQSLVFDGCMIQAARNALPLEKLAGKILVDKGTIKAGELRGKTGGGDILFSPNGFNLVDESGAIKISWKNVKAPVEAFSTLMPSFKLKKQDVWDAELTTDGDIVLSVKSRKLAAKGKAIVKAGYIVLPNHEKNGPGVVFRSLSGIAMIGKQVKLRDFRGVVVGGRFYSPEVVLGQPCRNWRVEGMPLEISEQTAKELSPETVKTLKDFDARGTIDVFPSEFAFNNGEKILGTRVRLHGVSFTHPLFRYRVFNAEGELELYDGLTVVHKVAGRHGATKIVLDGVFPEKEKRVAADFGIEANQLVVDRPLLSALPKEVGAALIPLAPVGVLNLRVRIGGRPGSLTLVSDVQARPLKIRLDANECRAVASLHLQAAYTDRGWQAFSGVYESSETSIEEMSLKDVKSKISWDGKKIQVKDLQAKLLGGKVEASFTATTPAKGKPVEYAGQIEVQGLHVQAFARFLPSPLGDMTGVMDASTVLAGEEGASKAFRSSGRIAIRDGNLGALPKVFGLLNLLKLKSPKEVAFTSGRIVYHVEGGLIVPDLIELEGEPFPIHGRGKYNMKTKEVVLRFYIGKSPEAAINPVDKAAATIAENIVEVRLQGSQGRLLQSIDPVVPLSHFFRRIAEVLSNMMK